jgi:uncharacterized membrane protein
MIVSLEAIFLSTFVMISQNRADAKRQVVANLQWRTVQEKTAERRAPEAAAADSRADEGDPLVDEARVARRQDSSRAASTALDGAGSQRT